MINKHGLALTALMLVLLGGALRAQTKDSSNAEIKKQALEMRDKLNRYMADRLSQEDAPRDTGMRVFFDSISTRLYNQQAEIDALKLKFAELETLVRSGHNDEPDPGKGGKRGAHAGKDVPAMLYEQDGENKLSLYFAFDSYKLNAEQKAALKAFLKTKKIKRVRLTGYTDWHGTEEHNTKLAENRCMAVVKILNQLIIHYQFTTKDRCLTANEHIPEKAQWCRRVEVVLY